jgi:hypothetical protein
MKVFFRYAVFITGLLLLATVLALVVRSFHDSPAGSLSYLCREPELFLRAFPENELARCWR